MNAGVIAAVLIGLAWLVLGWALLRTGRRRAEAASWDRAVAVVCDRDGSIDGVLTSRPYLRYAAPDGRDLVRPSGSRGSVWQPGAQVDVRVDPRHPDRVLLQTAAERSGVYVVVGWFIVVVAVLTLLSAGMLQWFVPR